MKEFHTGKIRKAKFYIPEIVKDCSHDYGKTVKAMSSDGEL
jgi:hypothetical protein